MCTSQIRDWEDREQMSTACQPTLPSWWEDREFMSTSATRWCAADNDVGEGYGGRWVRKFSDVSAAGEQVGLEMEEMRG